MIYLLYNDGSQSELEKSKSIYEYGSMFIRAGSPAFWRRHCQLSVSGENPGCHMSCSCCWYLQKQLSHMPPFRMGGGSCFRVSFPYFFVFLFKGGTESGKGGKALLSLHATDGTIIRYYYWFSNFLVYGGAGSGKTKSIGKPLMEQYIRSGFAGFIYDFKDFDYTRTAS